MLIGLKKWHKAGVVCILVMNFILYTRASCLEFPLNHEPESFLKCSPLSSHFFSENISTFPNSLLNAISSGVTFIRNHPIKFLLLGLAILPVSNAFSVINLNQTVSYTYRTNGIPSGILPIIIAGTSPSDICKVAIRHVSCNFTSIGKSSITPSYTPGSSSTVGWWNVTGDASEVNAITARLFFTPLNTTRALYFFIPTVTCVATGETAAGRVDLRPTDLAASNLPQLKNYTRNGSSVDLDPIVISGANQNIVSIRMYFERSVMGLAFFNSITGVTITDSVNNESFYGIYSHMVSIPSSPLSQVNTLLTTLRYHPDLDNASDIFVGISVSDATGTIYNVIMLTPNVPITTQSLTRNPLDIPTSTKHPSASLSSTLIFSTNTFSSFDNSSIPLPLNPSDTPLSAIVGGTVGGFIVMGSLIIAVVVFNSKKSSSEQNHSHDLEIQAPSVAVSSADTIQYASTNALPSEAAHPRYLAFSQAPNRVPSSHYEDVDSIT